MQHEIHFTLKKDTIEELNLFCELLKKDYDTILDEALQHYFDEQRKQMIEKNLEDENMQTNLDYDEFWEGVDI